MSKKASKPMLAASLVKAEAAQARNFFLLPLLALLVLVTYAPHALDIAISKPFFDGIGWPWHGSALFSAVFHKGLKAVPILIALFAIAALAEAFLARRRNVMPFAARWFAEPEKRLLYLLAAMAASLVLVWWLKGTTGVVCPWNAEPFGGGRSITDPSFSFSFRDGRCWPGGHAGTGFCLFALYFMLRDEHPKGARWAFFFALFLGVIAGVARLMQGAHFASHNIATMLIDWLVCAGIYTVFFEREKIFKMLSAALTTPLNRTSAILFSTLWWTIVFDMPLSKQLLERTGDNDAAFLLATLAAFFFVGAALSTILSMLPRAVFGVVLAVFAICGAAAFTGGMLYGVVFSPDMVRNVLATDAREASQYFGLRTVATFLFAVIPPLWAAWLAGKKVVVGSDGRSEGNSLSVGAGAARLSLRAKVKSAGLSVLAALGLLALGLSLILLNFQTFAGVMRSDKTLRYQIAPVNVVYSTIRTLTSDSSPDAKRVRAVVDSSPVLTAKPEAPTLFVVFVGETTRSANWQLSGYDRPTNPKLSAIDDLISFPKVEACGTSTDVSLPCMMSRIGRSNYDRERILSEEALPDVLQRAGAEVLWIDNQSGCKGVCAGVPTREPKEKDAYCPDGNCYDGVFVKEIKHTAAMLKDRMENAGSEGSLGSGAAGKGPSTTVLFLHMYGSHGPAYFKGSPASRKVFGPECTAADLSSCPVEEIRNAYDNSVLETDATLADSIEALRQVSDAFGIRTGMVWVSDHGESLGENGLFLHGAPRVMAPAEQLTVPMVMWFSESFAKDYGVDRKLLQSRASGNVTHENLYSTVLGLLKVKSTTYRKAFDLSSQPE